eukprot:9498629-Pyramimonas_sp.AAC.1
MSRTIASPAVVSFTYIIHYSARNEQLYIKVNALQNHERRPSLVVVGIISATYPPCSLFPKLPPSLSSSLRPLLVTLVPYSSTPSPTPSRSLQMHRADHYRARWAPNEITSLAPPANQYTF